MADTTTDPEVLKELGLDELLPEGQEDFLLDLNELVYESAMLRIIEQMDDETKSEFDALLDADPDEDQIQSFLSERVPAADQIIADTVRDLGNDILAATGESQD